ncbi:hypothetical protein NMY22_g11197 [Coprinellus aureogranulatus]|nr:hypothetical protein NMY22_g11197 [Coprinellus aureogranulatus]
MSFFTDAHNFRIEQQNIQDEVVGLIRRGDELDEPKKMVWLGGPAGCGKTAIAGSVAETCKATGLLAGTFFFSSYLGSADRRSKRCVITTLAYHLAGHQALHQYKVQLSAAIQLNPGIFRKRLLEQAQCLILDPLLSVRVDGQCDTSTWPRGILLDGLDEVQAVQYHEATREGLERTDDADQLEILEVLHALANCPAFPFCIFISSRPERVISNFFETIAQPSTVALFLDSKYNPDADIERFLQSRFAEIRRRFGISNSSWPGKEVIEEIVEMSSGQFIVATTVLRYVESGLPQRQLEDIMQVGRMRNRTKNPFALLDALYIHIINRSPDPRLVVTWIRCITGENFKKPSAYFWKAFLEDTEGEFYHLLTPLASLVSIPPYNGRRSPVTMYHKSFTDFLTSPVRSGEHYVGEEAWHEFAAGRYVSVVRNDGPKIPLSSSDDLHDFLSTLLSLELFPVPMDNYASSPGSKFSLFLRHLSEGSLAELATCDVASWTRFILREYSTSLEVWQSGSGPTTVMLGGLYCNMHFNVCIPISRSSNNVCHTACTHWRKGILDEAWALGWCVHELDAQPLKGLSSLSTRQFEQKFKILDEGTKCDDCQRPSNAHAQQYRPTFSKPMRRRKRAAIITTSARAESSHR